MKIKLYSALLLSLSACLSACSCSSNSNIKNNFSYRLELTGSVELINNKDDIQSTYKVGEKIRIELASVTDVSFYVFVNDKRIDETSYNSEIWCGIYEFEMPNEKATVVITSDRFYHQTFTYADLKSFNDSNVVKMQVKIVGDEEKGLATYYTSSDTLDIKNFKELAHKELKRSSVDYTSDRVTQRVYLKNVYPDGDEYTAYIDIFDKYLIISGGFNGPEIFEFVDNNYVIPSVKNKEFTSYSFYNKSNPYIGYTIKRSDDSIFDDHEYSMFYYSSLENFEFVELEPSKLSSILNTEILYYLDVDTFGRIDLINETVFRWNNKYYEIIKDDFYAGSIDKWPYTYAIRNDTYYN